MLWLLFQFDESFCHKLNLKLALKPLLDYNNGYIAYHSRAQIVMIRRAGFSINATHVLKIAKRSQRSTQLKTKLAIKDSPLEYQGNYCGALEGLSLCRSHNLPALLADLRRILGEHGHGQKR